MLLDVIGCCWLSLGVVDCHWVLLGVVGSLSVIMLLRVIVGCHWMSLCAVTVIIRCCEVTGVDHI